MAQNYTIASAACRLYINGKIIGAATSITYTRDQGVRPIYGIDNPLAQEIAITGPYSVRGALSGLKVRFTGGLDGLGIINASTLQEYFNQNYCTIELVDRKLNRTIGKIDKAIFNVDSVSAAAKDFVTVSAQFIGTFLSTEISPGNT